MAQAKAVGMSESPKCEVEVRKHWAMGWCKTHNCIERECRERLITDLCMKLTYLCHEHAKCNNYNESLQKRIDELEACFELTQAGERVLNNQHLKLKPRPSASAKRARAKGD